ncbi:MAG: YicC family protein [Sphaerochaetaceae bacterium]|nr:YicC family protein [Sphaerochaetaceae bacterium]
MRSMTAYGYAEFQNENYLMTMELKSYNNRYLEISYNAPSYLSSYENTVNEIIKTHAQRGHIDFSIKVKNIKGNVEVNLDEDAAEAYLQAIRKIRDKALQQGMNLEARLADVLDRDGVLTSVRTDGIEAYQAGLDQCMACVMEQFDASKAREGLVTQKDLTEMIDSIAASLENVKSHVAELDKMIKDNLTSRIHEMLGDQNYDENRILTEVAVMLNRYTINEEVVRLGAHIAEFRKLLKSTEAVGKRMDFLSQEMNREINTIGSKSQMVEINFEVVNMKDRLENIREQIRNIE